MKIWHSFMKEMLLASRSFYFYIELFMAFLFLFLLLFVIPENFNTKSTEYIFVDLEGPAYEYFMDLTKEEDLDGVGENVELKSGKEVFPATLYETEGSKFYYLNDRESVIRLAEEEKNFGGIITLDDEGELRYEYYLQGYESERMRNILLIFHNEDMNLLKTQFDAQEVRTLSNEYVQLTDRQNVIPSFLTFNGGLMGLFIIAAYIFLDKNEGVIKAYAVTPSSVWQYLLSKIGVILVVSVFSSLIIVIPIMGLQPNYLILILFLLASGIFASALGLLLASFYKNIMQAFAAIFVLMILFLLPNIAYFIPSWDPVWMRFIPSYPMLEGFKEIIIQQGDIRYVLITSFVFFVVGLILFMLANQRYKKTLTV